MRRPAPLVLASALLMGGCALVPTTILGHVPGLPPVTGGRTAPFAAQVAPAGPMAAPTPRPLPFATSGPARIPGGTGAPTISGGPAGDAGDQPRPTPTPGPVGAPVPAADATTLAYAGAPATAQAVHVYWRAPVSAQETRALHLTAMGLRDRDGKALGTLDLDLATHRQDGRLQVAADVDAAYAQLHGGDAIGLLRGAAVTGAGFAFDADPASGRVQVRVVLAYPGGVAVEGLVNRLPAASRPAEAPATPPPAVATPSP